MKKIILNTVNPINHSNVVEKKHNTEHDIWMCKRANGKWYIHNLIEVKYDVRQPQNLWLKICNHCDLQEIKAIIKSVPMNTVRRNQVLALHFSNYLSTIDAVNEGRQAKFKAVDVANVSKAKLMSTVLNRHMLIYLIKNNLVEFKFASGDFPNKQRHRISSAVRKKSRINYQLNKHKKINQQQKEQAPLT